MVIDLPVGEATDRVLEFAARKIEEESSWDVFGLAPRAKRAREDAELRRETRRQYREELARRIRAFQSRNDLAPIEVLRRIVGKGDRHSDAMDLLDAWPLAWGNRRWLTITCEITCTDNSVPPQTVYRIRATQEGLAALAAAEDAATTPEATPQPREAPPAMSDGGEGKEGEN
jgi:hypothetical protein